MDENNVWSKEFLLGDSDREELQYLVLIIYDIVDNKKRRRFAKYLSGFGFRVQRSAFEAIIDKKLYDKLLEGIPYFVGEEDSIRVYKLLGNGDVKAYGDLSITDCPDFIIV